MFSMPVLLTFQSHQAIITWPMPVFQQVKAFFFLTEVCDITWLNGDMLISGTSIYLLFCFVTYNIIYRPENPKELFNLRHASARKVIERIFGVLKRRFRILVVPPEYDMK